MLEKLTELKAQLDAHRPFNADILRNLEAWFEVELTYSSNAIEGNTLTRAETAVVLEKGLTVGGKPMVDHLEAINHRDALQFMKSLMQQKSITVADILSIHRFILKGIDDAHAGVIRAIPVRISGSAVVLPNYAKVPELMDAFVHDLQKQDHPATLAAMAHYRLVSIHPFVDGNGRTARLLMNLVLMQHGYPPAIIQPQDRLAYIKSLEEAQLGGSIDAYTRLIYKAIQQSLNLYIKALNYEEPDPVDGGLLLKIGALAKKTAESVATIRHWTKLGLLQAASTTPSGYQLYDISQAERCQTIRALQREGYNLEKIMQKLD